MGVTWQRLRVPLLERLALADLAQRRGQTEEEALASVIREAVMRECAGGEATPPTTPAPSALPTPVGQGVSA